jgi:hypothetical protein
MRLVLQCQKEIIEDDINTKEMTRMAEQEKKKRGINKKEVYETKTELEATHSEISWR